MSTYNATADVSADLGRFPIAFRDRFGEGMKEWHSHAAPETSTGGEQRIHPRFHAPCLSVRMRTRRLVGWEKETEAIECLDINRYGMALKTNRRLRPGSFILLDFRGHYITQSDVCSRVVSQVMEGDGSYRVSVQFNYCIERNHYSRSIDNALSQIEAFCRRQMVRYRN